MIKPFLFMKKKGTEKEIFALKSYETFKILANYKKWPEVHNHPQPA